MMNSIADAIGFLSSKIDYQVKLTNGHLLLVPNTPRDEVLDKVIDILATIDTTNEDACEASINVLCRMLHEVCYGIM